MYRDYLGTSADASELFLPPDGISTGETIFRPEYEKYIEHFPGRGTLKVQISVAREAFPLKGVAVEVAQILDGVRYSLYSDVTDISGIVDNMVLPASSIASTLNADTADQSRTEYLVSVYYPGFRPMTDCPVRVYDKTETLLPISLEPLSQEGAR